MLAIEINNEFLDLQADAGLELDRNNPYLTDDIQGDYSLGLTIKYSEKNLRLLQFTGTFYKKNEKLSIDASIYDNGLFRYAGVLVVNGHTTNMNKIETIVWTCLFTIGASAFYQSIQDKLLQDIDYGGIRTFAYTGDDPNDGSAGFWQHIHAARVPNSFPYTFYPISNEGWDPADGVTWMNRIRDDNYFYSHANVITGDLRDSNVASLCPAIYLKYLIEQIFAQFGWRIQGDVISDAGYQKLTMPSFRSIYWADFKKNLFVNAWVFTDISTVSFDLADHVPQSVTVGQFITNLKTRFGWYFDFDSNKKIAYLRALKNFVDTAPKDWTVYVLASYTAEYVDPAKIYSLVNDIDPGDTYPVLLNIDESALLPPANDANTLPDPALTLDGAIIYAFFQNQYYINKFNETTSAYEWIFYSHNIGDYLPANADTPIESDISTMPANIISHRADHIGFFPQCKQPGNFFGSPSGILDWGVRFLLYHGMQSDLKNDFSTVGALDYPYASCHCISIKDDFPLGDWSIIYRHQYGAVNDGTYDYWYKAWIALLTIQDFRTFTLQLPVTELNKFSFSDKIFINNVFFLVVSWKEILPYKGTVEARMKRIY